MGMGMRVRMRMGMGVRSRGLERLLPLAGEAGDDFDSALLHPSHGEDSIGQSL